jgi:hypothetical protein
MQWPLELYLSRVRAQIQRIGRFSNPNSQKYRCDQMCRYQSDTLTNHGGLPGDHLAARCTIALQGRETGE